MKKSVLWGGVRKVFQFLEAWALRQKKYAEFKEDVTSWKIACDLTPLTKSQKKEIKDYYKSTLRKAPKYYYHQIYYGANGNFAKEYIPEDLYQARIQPMLFDMNVCQAYDDKNLYAQLFPDALMPETIVKCSAGHYYDSMNNIISKQDAIDLCRNLESAIIKPSFMSAGGNGVKRISVSNGIEKSGTNISDLIESYGKNFVVQKVINQCEAFARLNPSSCNTIRISTYFREKEIIVLYAVMRIGDIGATIDNTTHGGYCCKIKEDGTLDNVAYSFTPVDRLYKTKTGITLDGYKIPCYNEVVRLAKKYHAEIPQIPIVGWDFTVDNQERVVLIEMNAPCGIPHQINCGPVYGKYTTEILTKCRYKYKFFK